MKDIKIPNIWNIYFTIGFFIVQLHFLEYFSNFLGGYITWHTTSFDFDLYTNKIIYTKLFLWFISIVLFNIRKYRPILSNGFIWIFVMYCLDKNVLDRFLFLSTIILIIVSFLNSYFLKRKLIRKK